MARKVLIGRLVGSDRRLLPVDRQPGGNSQVLINALTVHVPNPDLALFIFVTDLHFAVRLKTGRGGLSAVPSNLCALAKEIRRGAPHRTDVPARLLRYMS